MTYQYTLPNATDGIDSMMVQLVNQPRMPFIPMFLFFVFMSVFIGGVTAQKRRSGFSDVPQWMLLSSLSTLMVTILLSFVTGFVNLALLGIVFGITLLSGIWFFLSKGRVEG